MAELQTLPQTANENATAPNTNDGPTSGNPTTPAISRGQIANTSIAVSNSNLAQVCDISAGMKKNIAWVSLQIKELIETIRNAIQKLWSGVSGSPFSDGVSNAVTAIKAMVKQIQKLIAKAQEAQAAVQGYITQLQELLIYIQSIPARIAEFLKDCLSEVTASIKDAIGNAQSIVNSQSGGALSTATSSVTTASNMLAATQSMGAGSSSGPVIQRP